MSATKTPTIITPYVGRGNRTAMMDMACAFGQGSSGKAWDREAIEHAEDWIRKRLKKGQSIKEKKYWHEEPDGSMPVRARALELAKDVAEEAASGTHVIITKPILASAIRAVIKQRGDCPFD